MINIFIDYIRNERRYSENTILAYQSDLLQFKNFILYQYQLKEIKDVNFEIIRHWIVDLLDSKDSSRTVNRKISTLKSYFRFLIKKELIKINPLNKVITPKTKKRLPVFVEEEKMDMLFNNVEFSDTFEGIRDKLIIEILYCTGIRVSEMISIKINDVDFSNKKIKILGKRNKERMVPIVKTLEELLKLYISDLNKITEKNFIFVNKKGEQLNRKIVYSIVKKYLEKVTTIVKKSPHVLRHTFATHLLNNGSDIYSIKEILGHSSLSATQVYTSSTIEKMKQVYLSKHPKA